jgi:hypothetical protein
MNRSQEIKRLHQEIYGELRTTIQKAIRIGELLTEQKAELVHGEWEDWMRENLPFSRATACNYMHLYKNREAVKTLKLSGLSKAYKRLYGVAKKSKRDKKKKSAENLPKGKEFKIELTEEENKKLDDLLAYLMEKVFETDSRKATVFAALDFAKEHADA